MTKKIDYKARLREILEASSGLLDADDVFRQFEVGRSTVAKHLKVLLHENHGYIGRIIGFYPDADTVIDLAEQEVGKVVGSNVSLVNLNCKQTVDSITKPKHRQFLDRFLAEWIVGDGKTVSVDAGVLVDFLYEKYVNFVHESDNGLVSIAGTMNEKILIRGLEIAGFVRDSDYRKTGKNGEGDVQIEHRRNRTKILSCEIKSYAARERLLRGLTDIESSEKVGVGFFNDATEFNPERTQTLINAGPLAIYMPDETLALVDGRSREKTTRRQDRVYRPLSSFFADMVEYRNTGVLPSNR